MNKCIFLIISAFLFTLIISTPTFSSDLEHTFGWGVGLPYGGVGGNYELGVNDYFSPTIGIGIIPDNLGWNVGARFYYPGRDAKLRGRVTALYGTNTVREKPTFVKEEYEAKSGFSGGLGINWRFGNHWAFDADLFAIESDTPAGYVNKGSDAKFSLGFSWRW